MKMINEEQKNKLNDDFKKLNYQVLKKYFISYNFLNPIDIKKTIKMISKKMEYINIIFLRKKKESNAKCFICNDEKREFHINENKEKIK